MRYDSEYDKKDDHSHIHYVFTFCRSGSFACPGIASPNRFDCFSTIDLKRHPSTPC